MDIQDIQNLKEIAHQHLKLSEQYYESRKKAGDAKRDLEILLTASLKQIRSIKKNLGYDMAILIFMEDNEVARDLFKIMSTETSNYKGLERLIDAHQSTISLYQSIMRYTADGERLG